MVILLWAHPKWHIVASVLYSIQIVRIYLFLMKYVCHKSKLFCSRLPRWDSAKESACQHKRRKRPEFNPWVGKILWSRKWQLVSVFCWESPWAEEFGRLQSMESQRVRSDWANTTHLVYISGLAFWALLEFTS